MPEQGLAYEVGRAAEMTRSFTGEDLLRFAEITGDRNPIHRITSYNVCYTKLLRITG